VMGVPIPIKADFYCYLATSFYVTAYYYNINLIRFFYLATLPALAFWLNRILQPKFLFSILLFGVYADAGFPAK